MIYIPFQSYLPSSSITQVELQRPQGLSGAIQEVIGAHVLIHHHVPIRCIHRHLLGDVVAEGGKGVEGSEIWRGYIDVVDMGQIDKACLVGRRVVHRRN